VKAQLIALWERTGIADHAQRRTLYRRTELTSRIESSELPKVIDKLSTPYGSGHVDVCLASNIIEVGIDIPRLSLMTILGQPKTTAQYIQVSGRVGRRAEDRPGLIVTMYPPRRARDRSHFEKFRSYHQRLYAEVEPTSVTPWATPVLERAIHAVIIGYMRNMCRADIEPYPFPEDDFDKAVSMLRERMLRIEPGQVDDFERIVQRRRDEWESWQRSVWRGDFKEDQLPLMYLAGTYLPDDKRIASWETPGSMRNVDAECRVKISDVYLTRSAHE
jgi:excinuclease UvrABC helicase subunit UvrB